MSINLDDYRLCGGRYDWAAYKKAQVAAGDLCQKCGAYLPFPLVSSNSSGHPRSCSSCISLVTDAAEVSSDHYVRCPVCREVWNPDDNGFTPEEGEKSLQCRECEHEFEARVTVVYTYHSPPLVPEPEPAPEPEEDEPEPEPEGDT